MKLNGMKHSALSISSRRSRIEHSMNDRLQSPVTSWSLHLEIQKLLTLIPLQKSVNSARALLVG